MNFVLKNGYKPELRNQELLVLSFDDYFGLVCSSHPAHIKASNI